MDKKIVTLILVILISFCFLSIVVADNATHDDNNATDHDKKIDDDKSVDDGQVDKDKKVDKNKTDDKNKTKDKNKTDDKSKKNYIIAKGKGNDIRFSDGFRGFRLDYSKPAASPGDKFKHASASSASNSNKLKLAIIECYKLDSSDHIGRVMADFIKTGSSSSKVGEAVAASHGKISNPTKINNHTEAVFNFEVLKSVSGNESNYFAYTVSFRTINDEKVTTNNLTNTTNTTKVANTTNATNKTNITNMVLPKDNETNATFIDNFYDNLDSFINALYDAWKPLIDTLLSGFLMLANGLEGLIDLLGGFMMEIQTLMDALGRLLDMLASLWEGLAGLLKLLGIILAFIDQLLNLIGAILNFIIGLISAIISLIEQLLGWLFGLIDFLLGLLNQILSFIQAILDFLTSLGSNLIKVIENGAIIITSFVIITIGAFIYNRIR